ncbi:hypothetical protein JYU16_00745 [bacterium AH-315-M05]|nr:hypothetical protein [bacterium AH-315-M05]
MFYLCKQDSYNVLRRGNKSFSCHPPSELCEEYSSNLAYRLPAGRQGRQVHNNTTVILSACLPDRQAAKNLPVHIPV